MRQCQRAGICLQPQGHIDQQPEYTGTRPLGPQIHRVEIDYRERDQKQVLRGVDPSDRHSAACVVAEHSAALNAVVCMKAVTVAALMIVAVGGV